MSKVVIQAPASSANLGSGFDTMGLALSLYNTVELEECDRLVVTDADHSGVPLDESNLVYQTVKQVYQQCGRSLPGLSITQKSPIPQARGLGSSSACIAAGIVGANRLLGSPLSAQEMLEFACSIEGHPDNVAPAMLGGYVTSVMEGGKVYTLKRRVDSQLEFVAFIPDFPLLTAKARAALPAQVSHKDAVYNVSRAAMMAAAFCEGRSDLFWLGAQDRLHQPYRIELIPGASQLLQQLPGMGALAVFISGAGPTMLAVIKAENTAFLAGAEALLRQDEQLRHFKAVRLSAHNESMV
ncbi:MAG: homoserine kinase [Pygmaiobacter massiliensis]|nr:homoserine kinase [Pygmaiobacter massiliensis]